MLKTLPLSTDASERLTHRGSYAVVKHAVEVKTQKSFAIKIFDRLNQDFSAKLLEQEVRHL